MNKMTFKQVMDEVKAKGLTFRADDGGRSVSAECYTDDPAMMNEVAVFNISADWEVTARSPITDVAAWNICQQIESKIGGHWGYSTADNTIEQVEG